MSVFRDEECGRIGELQSILEYRVHEAVFEEMNFLQQLMRRSFKYSLELMTLIGLSFATDRTLIIGKTRMGLGQSLSPQKPLYHFVVYFNNTMYEIPGDLSSENRVRQTKALAVQVAEEYEIIYKAQLDITKELNVTSDVISDFIYDWQVAHKHYHILYNNCQDFAQDFAREVFRVEIVTQSDQVFQFALNVLKKGSLVLLVFALVLLVTVGLITAYGLLLKRSEVKTT